MKIIELRLRTAVIKELKGKLVTYQKHAKYTNNLTYILTHQQYRTIK